MTATLSMDDMPLEDLPKPALQLVGLNGNAYSILGRFIDAAQSIGRTETQRAAYVKEATAGDYGHLLRVTCKYIEEIYEDDEGEDDDYEEGEQEMKEKNLSDRET